MYNKNINLFILFNNEIVLFNITIQAAEQIL